MDDIDPRAAKLLGDLLALALADNDAQAEAALAALRRRAAADGVSGGAMKQVVEQVLAGLHGPARTALDEVHQLRWMLDDLRRELGETRLGRQRAEAALARGERARAAQQTGADAAGRLQRTAILLAFLGGLGVAGLAAFGFAATGGSAAPGAGLRAQVASDLRDCFRANSNSLAGTPFDMHLQVWLDPQGQITDAQWAPQQQRRIIDFGRRTYSDMVIRTLKGGSCGALALPASLRGKPARLDLTLPQ